VLSVEVANILSLFDCWKAYLYAISPAEPMAVFTVTSFAIVCVDVPVKACSV